MTVAAPDAGDGVRTGGAGLPAELALLCQSLAALGRQRGDGSLAEALAGLGAALRDLDEAGVALGRPSRWWELLGRAPACDYFEALDRAAVEADRLGAALGAEERRLADVLRALQGLQARAERLGRDLGERIARQEARLTDCDPETRDDLERQVHDLRLTRTVLSGTLAGIRSATEAEALVARRVAALRNVVLPGWEAQMAPLIAAARAAPGQRLEPGDLGLLRAATAALLVALDDGAGETGLHAVSAEEVAARL